jgi:hypothetical protein
MLRIVRAAESPKIIADPHAKTSDPIILTFEDKYRKTQARVVQTDEELKALTRQINRNEIRLVQASGPEAKVGMLGQIAAKQRVKVPAFAKPPSPEELAKAFSGRGNRLDQYFQGLPNLTIPDISDPRIGLPMETNPPSSPSTRFNPNTNPATTAVPKGPLGTNEVRLLNQGQGTVRDFQPGERDIRQNLLNPKPEPAKPHPAEEFAEQVRKTLGERGYKPVQGAAAMYQEGEPAGYGVKVVVPETGQKLITSRTIAQEPIVPTSVAPKPEPGTFKLFDVDPAKLEDTRTPSQRKLLEHIVETAKVIRPDDPNLNPVRARTIITALGEMADTLEYDRTMKRARPISEIPMREFQQLIELRDNFVNRWYQHIVPGDPRQTWAELSDWMEKGDTSDKILQGIVDEITQRNEDEIIPRTPARGYIRDIDGRQLPVKDNGDGTVTVTFGRLNGGRMVSDATPQLREAASALTDQEVAANVNKPEPKILQHQPFGVLQKGLEAVNKLLSDPNLSETKRKDFLEKRAELLSALKQRLGPEMPSTHTPADVVKPRGGLAGFSKGSAGIFGRFSKYGKLDESSPLSGIAKALGHGEVYRSNDGITVIANVNGQKMPLTYPDEFSATAGLLHMMNEQHQSAEFETEIEKAIETDILPPVAEIDPESLPFIEFNRAISMEPTEPHVKGVAGKFMKALASGRSILTSYGPDGAKLAGMSDLYQDSVDQLVNKLDVAIGQFQQLTKGFSGPISVRKMEAGEYPAHVTQAYQQTIGKLLDQFYTSAQALGIETAPRVEGIYVPHFYEMAEVARRVGVRIPSGLMQSMVEAGLANDPHEALGKFIETGGFVSIDRERTIEQMVQSMSQNRGQTVSRAEAEKLLSKIQTKGAGFAPNLQEERMGGPGYSDDLIKSVRIAARRNIRKLSEAQVFGTRLELLNNLVDKIREDHGSQAGATAQEIMNAVRGRNLSGWEGAFDVAANTLMKADRTYLTMSPLYHIPQNFFTVSRFGFGRFIKGFGETLKDMATPEGREAMKSFGAIVDHAFDDLGTSSFEAELVEGQFGRTARIVGNAAAKPLEVTINFSRRIAWHVGRDVFDSSLRKLSANPEDAGALKLVQELMGRKVSTQELLNLKGDVLQEARGMAGKRAADWAFFRFDPMSMPAALRAHPLVRMFMQFKNFLYPYTQLISHELFGKDVPVARRARMLLSLGLLYPAYGYGMSKVRESLGAGTRRTREVVTAVDKAMKDPTVANWFHAWASGMAVVHGFGFFQAMFDSATTGNAQDILGIAGVPSLGYIGNMVLAGRSLAVGVYNYEIGKKAAARYHVQKSAEAVGREFGGAGQAIAHKAVGRPRKPRKVGTF